MSEKINSIKKSYNTDDLNKDREKNFFQELSNYKRAWNFFQKLDSEIKNDKNLFPEIKNKNDFIIKNNNYLKDCDCYKLFEEMIFSWESFWIGKNNLNHFYFLEILYNEKTYQKMLQILEKEKKYPWICNEIKKELDIIDQNIQKIHRIYDDKEGYRDKIKWTNFLIQVCKIEILIIKQKKKEGNPNVEKWLEKKKKNLDDLMLTIKYHLSYKNSELMAKIVKKIEKIESLIKKSKK